VQAFYSTTYTTNAVVTPTDLNMSWVLEKSGSRRAKPALSLKRLKIERKLLYFRPIYKVIHEVSTAAKMRDLE